MEKIMIQDIQKLQDFLYSILKSNMEKMECIGDQVIIYTSEQDLLKVISFLKYHSFLKYNQLMDVTCLDYPDQKKRFHVVYQLLSIENNGRITIKVPVDELTPVPSVGNLFPSAGWFEREVWDLFGVFFLNHPDLRRILTDYGFQGHPLRKDFPVTGYYQVRYDDEKKRIISEPVELSQQIRTFDYVGPWNQLKNS